LCATEDERERLSPPFSFSLGFPLPFSLPGDISQDSAVFPPPSSFSFSLTLLFFFFPPSRRVERSVDPLFPSFLLKEEEEGTLSPLSSPLLPSAAGWRLLTGLVVCSRTFSPFFGRFFPPLLRKHAIVAPHECHRRPFSLTFFLSLLWTSMRCDGPSSFFPLPFLLAPWTREATAAASFFFPALFFFSPPSHC